MGLRKSFVLIALLSVPSPSFAVHCRGIPEQSEAPLATYCETDDSYVFDLSGNKISFAKPEFKGRLSESIQEWWSQHGLDQQSLSLSHVEVWLSVPEANPAAAQARAVVFSPLGNVSLSFDLNNDSWNLVDREAAILDRSSYPQTYGWRPQQVMIAFNKGTDPTKAAVLLNHAGLKLGPETSPGWYIAESKIFDETNAINRLMQLDQWTKLVQSAQTNQLFEWIAVRGKTVQFDMANAE